MKRYFILFYFYFLDIDEQTYLEYLEELYENIIQKGKRPYIQIASDLKENCAEELDLSKSQYQRKKIIDSLFQSN